MKWNQNATRLLGYNTEQRGNWAGEHTAILSNVSNKQNLQMFVCTNDLWSYRNPRRLDGCPLPNRNTQWRCHSPVEKKKSLFFLIHQTASFKTSPRFFLLFFSAWTSVNYWYILIICSEVFSFFKHFFKKNVFFSFFKSDESHNTLSSRLGVKRKSLMFYCLVSASCFSLNK